ncbi:hypothetical protein POM88_032027 [Heracleum sosnowskyi]|uniref:PHD finger protein ALFIN-LIKE n=1 Tax=Heracleum sosnowskyi TaxID=360622 RepID=A0AAD8HYH2_9APIA|nr:hypothetical protein POM88_032027 [Heracleum sosnowskyi]
MFQVKLKTNVAALAAGFRANSKELQTQANGDGKPATGAKTTGTEQVGGRTVKVNFPEVPTGGEREVMGPKIRSNYQTFVDIPHKLCEQRILRDICAEGMLIYVGFICSGVCLVLYVISLCLYGLPNEKWEVNLPVEEVPPEMPDPTLGINFARDGMQEKDWLSLVADSWLLSVAF